MKWMNEMNEWDGWMRLKSEMNEWDEWMKWMNKMNIGMKIIHSNANSSLRWNFNIEMKIHHN